jgi:hypothetical protein
MLYTILLLDYVDSNKRMTTKNLADDAHSPVSVRDTSDCKYECIFGVDPSAQSWSSIIFILIDHVEYLRVVAS